MTNETAWLVDRTVISETITRYFNSLDLRDWRAMRATLADEIEVDFSELFGAPRETHAADAFVGFAEVVLSGFTATQHISPNHVVELSGDTATASAGMYAWHLVPPQEAEVNTLTLRGRYDIGMVRAADGWRMNKLHMAVWDQEGNLEIWDVARRLYDGG